MSDKRLSETCVAAAEILSTQQQTPTTRPKVDRLNSLLTPRADSEAVAEEMQRSYRGLTPRQAEEVQRKATILTPRTAAGGKTYPLPTPRGLLRGSTNAPEVDCNAVPLSSRKDANEVDRKAAILTPRKGQTEPKIGMLSPSKGAQLADTQEESIFAAPHWRYGAPQHEPSPLQSRKDEMARKAVLLSSKSAADEPVAHVTALPSINVSVSKSESNVTILSAKRIVPPLTLKARALSPAMTRNSTMISPREKVADPLLPSEQSNGPSWFSGRDFPSLSREFNVISAAYRCVLTCAVQFGRQVYQCVLSLAPGIAYRASPVFEDKVCAQCVNHRGF